MPQHSPVSAPPRLLRREQLDSLIEQLRSRGYRVVGPTVREEAIVYAEIRGSGELPIGKTDEQAPGKYRLRGREDERVFGYAVGPHSWKQFFHVPVQRLFVARKVEGKLRFEPEPVQEKPLAVLGARGCDLSAIETQDLALAKGPHADSFYRARREDAFIVALHCSVASASCFCTSMGTGPAATRGFDLALTELCDSAGHRFVVDVKSAKGLALTEALGLVAASEQDVAKARGEVAQAAQSIQRQLNTANLSELLTSRLEHPRWDDVAKRCLSCSSCTDVCPTCFCTSVEDQTSIDGSVAERSRKWDSCFTADFSYLHGGAVRAETRSRYRQWLTHKFSSWHEQFGRAGCVGCGRCITWCPVGIDVTEELSALRRDAKEVG